MMSRILLLVLGLFYCVALSAQILNPCQTESYFKSFGTSGTDEQGISLLPAPDGGVYTTGAIGNEALITKLDSNGQLLWARTLRLDTSRQVLLFELIRDSDGMLVAVGTEVGPLPLQLPMGLVLRYDPVNDTILWVKRIDSGFSVNAGILEKSAGGNFIFYQTIVKDTTFRTEVEILELNRNNGDAVAGKGKRISRTEAILFSTILLHNDSLYAVGALQMTNTGGIRHLLARLDTVGFNPDWARSSHLDTLSTANFIAEDLLVDNDTLVSLYANVDTTGGTVQTQIFLQKTTLGGDLVWVKQYDITQTTDEAPIDLVQLDSGYAIYGFSGDHYFFLPVDHDGNAKNAFTLNGAPFTVVTTPLPFAKNEAYATGNELYLNGSFTGLDADLSLLNTTLGQNIKISCGYIQPLDSVVTTNVLNPFSQTIAMQISPSPTVPAGTSASFVDVTLPETLLCPVLSPVDTLDLGPDIITCQDTSFLLDAGPGYASYLWQDSTTAQTLVTTGTEVYWVEVTDSCGIVQRDSILVTVNLSGDTQFPDQVLCSGDSVTLGAPGFDTYLWEPNIGLSCDTCATVTITPDSTRQYTLAATSVDGCFLIDTFLLIVVLPSSTFDTLTACAGDSILFNGIAYFTDTILVDTLSPTQGACDTITTTRLLFNPGPISIVTVTRCQGDVFVLNGTPYTQNAVVTLNVPAPVGCDSSITFNLNFLPLPQLTNTITVCASDTIFLGGQSYTVDTVLIDTLAATTGCDTLRTRQLIFTPLPILADTLSACAGDSISFGGILYTQNTILTLDTLPASGGNCDTLVQRILIFTPLPIQADTLTACAGDSITFGGLVYLQDTTLTIDTLPATGASCDTLVQTILIFSPLPTRTDLTLACSGDSINIGGIVYTQDITLTTTLPASVGCDTLVTTQLIFRIRPVQADTLTACAGDSLTLGGIVYLQDTTVTIDTLPTTGGGCDTLVQTILIFNPLPIQSDTITACAGDSVTVGGIVYIQNTTVTIDTLPATSGSCDTLVQRILIFNPLPVVFDTITACEGDTLLIQGIGFTQDTTVAITLLPSTTGGCDTSVVQTLTFLPVPTSTDSLQLCQGDTVTIGGVQYFQTGTVVDTIPATVGTGCDTIATYVITILPRPLLTDSTTLCQGDTVTIGGVPYFQTTTLLDTIPSTTGGCDTISRFEIIVLPKPTILDTIKFLPGDTVIVNGVSYAFPVILVDTLPSPTGCDTIVTTTLQWITKFTLTCPPDLTVTTAPGTPTTIVDYDLPSVNTECPGGGQPTITLLSGIPIGGTFGLGTTEICYTAADTCGNVDTCCFKITVVEGEMACDVKTNGCFRWEMLPIKLDSVGNRRYRIKVINNCAQKLNYVLFRLPNGINALAPANNSIYTSPTSSPRKYIVRNPNFSPVYSVRFKADSSTVLNNGVSDIFEYKLPQQSAPKYIYTYAKLADGTYFEAHLNVFNCPELPWPNFVPNPDDRRQDTDLSAEVELYPNPTEGILFLNLKEVPGESVFIRVLNTLGEEVQTATLPVADGLQTLQLDMRLQSGVYQLVVQPKDGPAVVERFVLQRN